MEKTSIYVTRFGSLAEMGIFREHLIAGVTTDEEIMNYCLHIANTIKDKQMPFAVARHLKFTELQNTPK